MRAIGLQVS